MNLISKVKSKRMYVKEVAKEKAETSSTKKFLKDLIIASIIATISIATGYIIFINL